MGGRENRWLDAALSAWLGRGVGAALRIKIALAALGVLAPWVLLALLLSAVIAPPALPAAGCGGAGRRCGG